MANHNGWRKYVMQIMGGIIGALFVILLGIGAWWAKQVGTQAEDNSHKIIRVEEQIKTIDTRQQAMDRKLDRILNGE